MFDMSQLSLAYGEIPRLGLFPLTVTVTTRGNRNHNSPLIIRPSLRTVTGWGNDPNQGHQLENPPTLPWQASVSQVFLLPKYSSRACSSSLHATQARSTTASPHNEVWTQKHWIALAGASVDSCNFGSGISVQICSNY